MQSTCAVTSKLTPDERKYMAVRGMAGATPVSELAIEHNVSRPTVYRQMERAGTALDELFAPVPRADDRILL
ncbi:hypothetical protein ACT2FY_01065 [Paraburkholderia fungorum]|uniref:hypothetical protein n=1 Tax=Paraburkholderia fungorum TaxID=134537 RepID=UPI00402B5FC5